ncbi:hypothetical protein FRC01_000351 [Tulasnella sp. 417]|nr:hypothetical protein FRC01_000351 [Tulasnella sp. 417]
MSNISSSDPTLKTMRTLEEPRFDPGLKKMKLKRTYSGQECFDQFHPYLVWLRCYILKNKWVPGEIITQFESLWNTYSRQETEYGRITAVAEFFSQKAHSEVEILWKRYRALRKKIEDMSTQRVTLRAAQEADKMASSQLMAGKSGTITNVAQDGESPEDYTPRNPFSTDEDDE